MTPDVTEVQPLSGDVEVGARVGAGAAAAVGLDDGGRHRNGSGGGGRSLAHGTAASIGTAVSNGTAVSDGRRATNGNGATNGKGTSVALGELYLGPGIAPEPFGAYLGLVDFYRVVVCLSVVMQHSFLWTGMSTNDIGTGFITMLHFTREAFFILSGLVVCYAEITRPRSMWGFWKRRYVQLGVPFLSWTLIYVVYTMLDSHLPWDQFGSVLWYDLRYGFYQLYVVIVLFQFYLVFPLLLWLLRVTSGKAHVLIVSVSVALTFFLGVVLHYDPDLGEFGRAIHEFGNGWPWSRNLVTYQVYFVVGAVVAFHLNQVLAFVAKWYRWILAATVTAGVGTLMWYLVDIGGGSSTGSASDIFQPIAVLWGLAASAGIFTLAWMWLQRRGQREVSTSAVAVDTSRRKRWRGRISVLCLAEWTGGIFLCHVLFINLVRLALYTPFVGGTNLDWPLKELVLYVGTLCLAIPFVAIIVRTPLRWVLGGPVRAEQRSVIDAFAASEESRAEESGSVGEPTRKLVSFDGARGAGFLEEAR